MRRLRPNFTVEPGGEEPIVAPGYLQTLREVSAESNSTTLFPIPIDLFKPFLQLEGIMEKAQKERPGA